MKTQHHIVKGSLFIALLLGAVTVQGQKNINSWRGEEGGSDWNDQYKWDLKHIPAGDESVHFREDSSVIFVNSTVQLNNGMHLYGQELSLQGNGNINLWNQIPHQRTVNIPASATGFANMTLNDNISVNGRIALSAKGFGTSASKGSITLKDRSNVTGILTIGNGGNGTGQVFVKGSSTYRITGLELDTAAESGGSAEIHVIGGTVRIETKKNPFDVFLADAGRKIILGDSGTLRIEFSQPVYLKKEAIKKMISQDRLVAAPGCRLTTPVIQEKMIIIRAEDERNDSNVKTRADLLASIDKISNGPTSAVAGSDSKPKKLESLLSSMRTSQPNKSLVATAALAPQGETAPEINEKKSSNTKIAGYIVVFGATLLVLRRSDESDVVEETDEK